MRNLVEWIGGAKAYVSLVFTGEVLIYTAIRNMLMGDASLPYSMIWQFLALAVIIPLLQVLCFSKAVIKELSTPLRLALLSVKVLCTLSIFAVVFDWFNVGDPVSWVFFLASILGAELILGLALYSYFRITGRQYAEKLQLYKEHHQ